jgi:hypothetical protein
MMKPMSTTGTKTADTLGRVFATILLIGGVAIDAWVVRQAIRLFNTPLPDLGPSAGTAGSTTGSGGDVLGTGLLGLGEELSTFLTKSTSLFLILTVGSILAGLGVRLFGLSRRI